MNRRLFITTLLAAPLALALPKENPHIPDWSNYRKRLEPPDWDSFAPGFRKLRFKGVDWQLSQQHPSNRVYYIPHPKQLEFINDKLTRVLWQRR